MILRVETKLILTKLTFKYLMFSMLNTYNLKLTTYLG